MKKRVLLLLCVAAVSMTLTGIFFWRYEHGANPNINGWFDVLWWWVVTSATVGYGDIVPVTWQGRVVAIFSILTGFFIYANFVAIIAESVHGFLERRSHGRISVKASGHIVICEYTAMADELIQALPECADFRGRDAVIVTDLVSRNPYPMYHFVSGVPINPAVLKRASIGEADYVFIFANLRFADPDIKTMHITTRVMALNPRARIFVELVNPGGDLLKYAPERVVPLDSRKLLEFVLKEGRITALEWAKMCFPAASA